MEIQDKLNLKIGCSPISWDFKNAFRVVEDDPFFLYFANF